MALLFILLAAWVVGAIMVLAFLGGAQQLGGDENTEAVAGLNALSRSDVGAQPTLRESAAPTSPRFRS